MKILKLLILIFLTNVSLFGQVFIGKSTDKMKNYSCLLQINKDNTIYFIYDRDENGVYGEHTGKIQKLNDTLYNIKATMTIGQFYMESFDNDTIYIHLDSCIAIHLDKILVTYPNGISNSFTGYNKYGKPIKFLKIPFDKNLFNKSKGTDYITINLNRKNPITGQLLKFKIPYHSGASFTSNLKEDFNIVIKDGLVWTMGNPPLQTGHFKLKKSGT